MKMRLGTLSPRHTEIETCGKHETNSLSNSPIFGVDASHNDRSCRGRNPTATSFLDFASDAGPEWPQRETLLEPLDDRSREQARKLALNSTRRVWNDIIPQVLWRL